MQIAYWHWHPLKAVFVFFAVPMIFQKRVCFIRLYLTLSRLRLHVTGLMDNADNLITISCFLPKQEISSMANLLIQLLYQEVYSLRSPISGPDVLFSFCRGKPQSSIQFLWKRKRTLPAVGDTSDATGNTQGLILCEKSDVNFLERNVVRMWAAVCWGGALPDETKTAEVHGNSW